MVLVTHGVGYGKRGGICEYRISSSYLLTVTEAIIVVTFLKLAKHCTLFIAGDWILR